MKVIHINKHASGGAFNAAFRQHLALLEYGIESYFLTLGDHKSEIPNHLTVPKLYNSRKQKLLNNFSKFRSKRRQHKLWLDEVGLAHPEIFTFPDSDYDLAKVIREHQPDVVNLHWVSGFLDVTTFFDQVNTPIVWTLHDQNPFLGGFHYEEKEPALQQAFGSLERRNIQLRQAHYPESMVVSAPSKWLSQDAGKSELMGKYEHVHIPYSLPTDTFTLLDQQEIRRKLDFPAEKKILLFVAEKVGVRRKGFDLLLEALVDLKDSIDLSEVEIVAIGNKSKDLDQYAFVRQYGYVNGLSEMASLYNAADAFVMPSRMDNLPNVMLESVSCGTPVIAFNVGGVPDVIRQGVNGVLAASLNAESLAQGIQLFLEKKDGWDRKQISQEAHRNFRYQVQAERYADLYRRMLDQ